ncbi:MAG TPA: gliding motility-associated C-terminal domain-containing protein, partial [Flavobacterium sp.]|nr:gliding motility-associated C-terminal domain-containing protein [Flavobacterium sp.]
YWEESNHLGVLNGSIWSPAGIPYGIHILKYNIVDACGVSDAADVTIHYNPELADPVLHADPFCNSQTIQLHVAPVANATYEWIGPNGFTSNLQDPEITSGSVANAGLYTVKMIVDGCESNANMELKMQPQPDFKLIPVCVNGNYTIAVKPNQDSFNLLDVSYAWTGPAHFTSTESQIQITGFSPGLYEVMVTNDEGCHETHSIPVSSTRCGIPTVITPNDDEHNDYFDLTGFDVKHIEIFNRWGRLVYKKENYTKEWYGQNMDNEELPDSTYYYRVALKTGEEKVGWVYKSSWR